MELLRHVIFKFIGGNPGAISYLVDLVALDNDLFISEILKGLEKSETLRGTNLYVFFNYLSDGDLKKAHKLLKNCPIDIIEKAASFQDRSGKKLIEKYLV